MTTRAVTRAMPEPHPLAKVLPAMSGEDYGRLRTDVAENGLVEPITLYEGKVLDGIHRQKVCDETGVEPRYEEFSGDDPLGFVFSTEPRPATSDYRAGVQWSPPSYSIGPVERGPGNQKRMFRIRKILFSVVPRPQEAVGVATSTVSQARRIKKERPDLAKKVRAGKTSLNAAVEEMTGKHTGGNGPRRTKAWNGKTNPTREREIHAARKNGKNGTGKDTTTSC